MEVQRHLGDCACLLWPVALLQHLPPTHEQLFWLMGTAVHVLRGCREWAVHAQLERAVVRKRLAATFLN